MKWIGSLALIFIALWAGVGTLDGGFISDDFVLLHTAQHVPIVKNFTSNWLGETGQGGFYRPIVSASWKIDNFLFGDNPRGYHGTNILLHILVTLLVGALILRVQKDGWSAFIAAAFFAIHPVHAEAIAWISGRTDLVAAVFYLLSINLFLSIHPRDRIGCLVSLGALAAGFMAMLSKEMAFTLPFVIVAIDRLQTTDEYEREYRTNLYFPYFLLLIGAFALRKFILGDFIGGYGAATHLRLDITIFLHLEHYITWLISPLGISLVRNSLEWHLMTTGLGLLMLTALISPKLRMGALWFVLTMIPALTICRQQYIYLPSIGFFWILGVMIRNGKWPDRTIAGDSARTILFVILVTVMGIVTVEKNHEWRKTGWVGEGLKKIIMSQHPVIPCNSRFLLINPPINNMINIGLFQNGFNEALQLWYHDQSLEGLTFHTTREITDYRQDQDLVMECRAGKFWDRTGHYLNEDKKIAWPGIRTPITLKNADQSMVLPGLNHDITGIMVYSQMANSTTISNGTEVAELDITDMDGNQEILTLIAGQHTSEWAYDRTGMVGNVSHSRAPIAYSFIGGEPPEAPEPGHVYEGDFRWPQTKRVKSLTIRSKMPIGVSQGEEPILEIRNIFGILP